MPKTLYLVRHAKSSWVQPGLLDFDRPLNSRGQRDAPEMGQRLKERDVAPETVVCSPARRAVQTLEFLNAALDVPTDSIFMQKRIYEASTETLLDIIRKLDDQYESAMIVGHNPSMTWLASQLSGSYFDNLPTCAVVALRLNSNHWKETGAAPAELIFFEYPKKTPGTA